MSSEFEFPLGDSARAINDVFIFAIPFARTVSKIKDARDNRAPVMLTADECGVLIQGFQIMRDGLKRPGSGAVGPGD